VGITAKNYGSHVDKKIHDKYYELGFWSRSIILALPASSDYSGIF
jgi:hypothetical protein